MDPVLHLSHKEGNSPSPKKGTRTAGSSAANRAESPPRQLDAETLPLSQRLQLQLTRGAQADPSDGAQHAGLVVMVKVNVACNGQC